MGERIRDLTTAPAESMAARAAQCRHKKRFIDKADAKREAKVQRNQYGNTVSIYTCPVCHAYHLTTR